MFEELAKFLNGECGPTRVSRIERVKADTLWTQAHDLGYLDALTEEARGGACLQLRDVAVMLGHFGAHGFLYPVADTLVVRRALSSCGKRLPRGPWSSLGIRVHPDGPISSGYVAGGGALCADE